MTQLYYHRQESTWSAEAHKEGIKITSWLTLARSKVYFFTKLSNSGIKVLIPNKTCSTNRDMEKTRFQQTLWEGERDFKKYNYEMRADTVQWVRMKAQSGHSISLLFVLTTTLLMQLFMYVLWLSASEPQPGFLSRTKHVTVPHTGSLWHMILSCSGTETSCSCLFAAEQRPPQWPHSSTLQTSIKTESMLFFLWVN